MKLRLIVLICAALAFGTTAAPMAKAQGPSFEPNWAAWGSQQLSNQQWEIQKIIHKKDWHQNADGAATAVHHEAGPRTSAGRRILTSTRYTQSPAVTEKVRQQFLQFIAARTGPEGEKAIADSFQKANILQAWARSAAQDGLHPNDVADAFTEYWVANWQMANGVMTAPHRQVRAVRDQFAAALAANPIFARLTPAQKQALSETYIYNDALVGTAYLGAIKNGDGTLQQRLGDAAVTRFQNEMHVNLRQITLSSRGFVAKG